VNKNPFLKIGEVSVKIGEAYHKAEFERLMDKLEELNRQNYKDAAIDVALETRNRAVFEKMMGSDVNG